MAKILMKSIIIILLLIALGSLLSSLPERNHTHFSNVPAREHIYERLQQSNESLYFIQREYDISANGMRTINFGIKNPANKTSNLKIEIINIGADQAETTLESKKDADDSIGSFFWMNSSQTFIANETKVFDMQYRAPKKGKSMQVFKIELLNESEENIATQIIFINIIQK